ncbi:Origin recognition complex, subunit 3 domain-containing protein [Rozella allomycis CSF55]|uniref:Origin recognition complex, subunit 3 domain-containing protein n=1 Tax=Rozella allomycis (strain CSF55) TaxID=988480 RepID=A0A075ANT7_ROZAC|nr:Origin recognition complex, subunit 3 domain-containing protein [Rozella allomycis CSF55]|eukprot:EPZ31592.1 Origin recognition complex, subunit 3 domain-containing protein [Rozella allomycis CSF55]
MASSLAARSCVSVDTDGSIDPEYFVEWNLLLACYIVQPKCKKPKTMTEHFVKLLPDEGDERMKEYQEALSELENIVDEVTEKVHQRVFNEMAEFVFQDQVDFMGDIPTALLFVVSLFQRLRMELSRNEKKSRIVILDQVNNLKQTVKSIITKFTKSGDLIDEEEIEGVLINSNRKRLAYDISVLNDWYETNKERKLILMIPDFEGCDAKVLEALICFIHQKKLNLTLIFGMATSMEMFHQVLTRQSCSFLQLELFKLEQPEKCLDELILKVRNEED